MSSLKKLTEPLYLIFINKIFVPHSREDNKKIKNNEIPEEWKDKPNKLAQKDVNAKWTIKHNETYYGYKNNAKVDSESKLLTKYTVTSANVHDIKEVNNLIDDKDRVLYMDIAYYRKEENNGLPNHIKGRVIKKGYNKKALTEKERFENNMISKVRKRIEHIFGFMTNKFRGLTMRCIGIVRAKFNIGLTNLMYNFFRYEYLLRNPIKIG